MLLNRVVKYFCYPGKHFNKGMAKESKSESQAGMERVTRASGRLRKEISYQENSLPHMSTPIQNKVMNCKGQPKKRGFHYQALTLEESYEEFDEDAERFTVEASTSEEKSDGNADIWTLPVLITKLDVYGVVEFRIGFCSNCERKKLVGRKLISTEASSISIDPSKPRLRPSIVECQTGKTNQPINEPLNTPAVTQIASVRKISLILDYDDQLKNNQILFNLHVE